MKKLFLLVLFIFPMIQFSYIAQAQESQQQEVQQEQMLRVQLQQGADETAANQKRMEQQSQQILIDQKKASEEQLHPQYAPAEQKKIDHDWVILYFFEGLITLLSLGVIVILILAHVPNRLNDPTRGKGLSMLVAIRSGMTQARYNASNNMLVWGEILFVSVLIGIYFKAILAFLLAFVGLVILLFIPTTAFIIVAIFSWYWSMVGGTIGYSLCGGQLTNTSNYVSAWIGGLICAVIAYLISLGLHFACLQYMNDLRR